MNRCEVCGTECGTNFRTIMPDGRIASECSQQCKEDLEAVLEQGNRKKTKITLKNKENENG